VNLSQKDLLGKPFGCENLGFFMIYRDLD